MRTWLAAVLSERTWLFLLSLGIAVAMWYYVGATLQPPAVQPQTASLRMHNVEVAFAGLADGWRASADPGVVDIDLGWPAPAVLAVRPTDVRAIADVTALEAGPHQVTLRIQVPAGVTAVQATPPAVTVTLIRR
jgi:YbbR domain-containing protein